LGAHYRVSQIHWPVIKSGSEQVEQIAERHARFADLLCLAV
jgi:hypothetical protein